MMEGNTPENSGIIDVSQSLDESVNEEEQITQFEADASSQTKFSRTSLRRFMEEDRIELTDLPTTHKYYSKFSKVVFDGAAIDFINCNECKEFFAYKKNKASRHVSAHYESFHGESKKLSQVENQSLQLAFAKWTCEKALSLSATDGKGFLGVLEEIIKLDRKYRGTLSPQTFQLPGGSSRRNAVNILARENEETLSAILSNQIKERGIAFCVDIWKEINSGINYLGISGQFITESGKLKELFLALPEITGPKTAENIKTLFNDTMHQRYGVLISSTDLVAIVSDRGSNMVKAFKEFPVKVVCYCHILHNVFGHLFSNKCIKVSWIYSKLEQIFKF